MRTVARVAIAAAILVGLAGSRSEIAQALAPCAADAHTFCRGLEPGHGAMQRCLQEHLGDLSSACRAHLQPGIDRVRTPRSREREGKGRAKKPDE